MAERCARCATSPRTLIARYRLGHEPSDSPRTTEALRALERVGVELDAEPWVTLACVCGGLTLSLPASEASSRGLLA